ncbi:hypothetical protein [Micromonospora sp. NPDC005367]|uniref:hypothetical protein n=1 Tax=Micromonospora sp. NPDC005367 TaxID=3155590 RepID=UPI0033BDB436
MAAAWSVLCAAPVRIAGRRPGRRSAAMATPALPAPTGVGASAHLLTSITLTYSAAAR